MAMQRLNTSSYGDEVQVELREKGATVEGYYLGHESFTSKSGDPITKHRFKNSNGEILSTLGSTMLNQDLQKIPAGTRVRVTYEGKEKSKKGRTFNKFAIEFDPSDTIAVNG